MQYLATNLYITRVIAVVIADALCLVTAIFLAWNYVSPSVPWSHVALGLALALPIAFVVLYQCDAYRLTLIGSFRESLGALMWAAALGTAGAVVVYLAIAMPSDSKLMLATSGALYFPLLILGREACRRCFWYTRHKVAVLGTGSLAWMVAAALQERRNLGFEFVGFIAESPDADQDRMHALGSVGELSKICERHAVDLLVLAEGNRPIDLPRHELLQAKLGGMRFESGMSVYERMTGRVFLKGGESTYQILCDGYRMGRISALIKRTVDLSIAATGLLLAAPVLALCALAIKLDSPGPVFFRQCRVGRAGRTFELVKFRSMKDRAELESGPMWAQGPHDSRITRVGEWLRKSRLDEIPQLWNVLRGDMSLVGPRPERPEFVALLSETYPYFEARSAVRPGISGWAQVRGGYVNDVEGAEEKLALDLFYIKYQSVFLDLWILWKTLRTVVLLKGM